MVLMTDLNFFNPIIILCDVAKSNVGLFLFALVFLYMAESIRTKKFKPLFYVLLTILLLTELVSIIYILFPLIKRVSPDVGFLSDIAAFEGVLISIAIPVSLDIISRISDRYNSNILSKQFNREWEIKILPVLLIINIVVAIILRFAFNDSNVSIPAWKILSWLMLVVFIFIAITLVLFIRKLNLYSSDIDHALKKLLSDAKKLVE